MGDNIIINESSSMIRALARESLREKWVYCALVTLLYGAVIAVPTYILDSMFAAEAGETSTVSTLYNLLIGGAMALGYSMFILSIVRERKSSVAEIFYGFENFGKALGLYIVRTIFVLLWTLLFVIPGIIAALRYSLCFFILADNPNMGIMEALNESKRLMYGNKWKLFCLTLSFIGWAILSVISFGIGFLWLYPYTRASLAVFYEISRGSLFQEQNRQIGPEY